MKSCSESRMNLCPAIFVIVTALCLAALGLSCSRDTGPCGSDEDLSKWRRTSPDSLMNFLAEAYEREDLDAYSEALSDFFEFEFTPDVADTLSLPEEAPWWGKTEDIGSTENMFNASEVIKIEMDLPQLVSSSWSSCAYPVVEQGAAEPETTWMCGLCTVFDPDIKVHIQKQGEEPLTLWVTSSRLDVMVVRDPDSPEQWVILRIKERYHWLRCIAPEDPRTQGTQTQFAVSEASTWGGIKSMFR